MAEQTWLDKTLHIWRLRLIGVTLTLLGICIMTTPQGAFGVTNFLQETTGIHPYIQGILMVGGGMIILLLKPKRLVYLACILPWLLYTVGAVVFAFNNHLAWTQFVAYASIYGFMALQAAEQA